MGRKKTVQISEKIADSKAELPTFKPKIDSSFYLILAYIVFSVSFLFRPNPSLFIELLPWLMVFSTLFVIYKIKPNRLLLTTIFLIISSIFVVQALTVLTGVPFGEFVYLNTLGPKLEGVPLAIVLNWSVLIISCYVFAQRLTEKLEMDGRFVLLFTPIIVTLMDYIMEPVAIYLRFWNWQEGIIPTSNYISWFFFGLFCTVFLYFINWGNRISNSKYPLAFLIGQTILFTVINILIIS